MKRLVDARLIVARFQFFSRATMTEDGSDFSNGRHRKARGFQSIEQRFLWWVDRVVLARFSSAEISRFADKWTGDDPANFILTNELFPSNLAPFIKPLQRNHLFVSGYLKYAVRRCVDN